MVQSSRHVRGDFIVPTRRPASNPPSGHKRRELLLSSLGLLAFVQGARAATTVSGLWSGSGAEHLVLLQDGSSGQTFGLQVPATLDAIKIWLGSGSATQISLQALAAPDDVFSATISNGNRLSGSQTVGGAMRSFSADLALGWVSTAYAGVWQKDLSASAYLVFCVLNTGNGRLALQVDVTLAADKSVAYDIFTGALNGATFSGLSLMGSGFTSRLVFDGATLQGTLSSGRPAQGTAYGATQIAQISA